MNDSPIVYAVLRSIQRIDNNEFIGFGIDHIFKTFDEANKYVQEIIPGIEIPKVAITKEPTLPEDSIAIFKINSADSKINWRVTYFINVTQLE